MSQEGYQSLPLIFFSHFAMNLRISDEFVQAENIGVSDETNSFR